MQKQPSKRRRLKKSTAGSGSTSVTPTASIDDSAVRDTTPEPSVRDRTASRQTSALPEDSAIQSVDQSQRSTRDETVTEDTIRTGLGRSSKAASGSKRQTASIDVDEDTASKA